ncbi:MAG: ABC transporter ATP-binding protein [Candidatus Methylacidiphilales bacterium]|nr:ABC transporter ATP-binding protein [Candidatus Methylacidiphilales bacterium]
MQMFLRVWVYARRYPLYAAGTLACAILTTLAGMVFPKATGLLLDAATKPDSASRLLPYVMAVGGAFLLRDLFNSLRIYLNNTFEQNVIVDLRQDIYESLQRLPLNWYDNRATGDLMTRVTDDVTALERMLIDGIEGGVVATLQIVGVGVVLCWLSPGLFAWMLLPIVLMIIGAWLFTTTAHTRYKAARTAASAMNSLLHDNLQGIRQIKSYAREGQEAARFAAQSDEVRRTTLGVMRAWAIYSPSMTFIGSLGFLLVLLIGGYDVAAGRFSPGNLVTFLLYTHMFYDPINRLHQLNQLFQAGRAAGGRVFEIMDAQRERYEPMPVAEGTTSSQQLTHVRGELEYRDIAFAYRPDQPILHNINFRIPAGTSLALVGPSGAGKTTIASLLPRFYELTGGSILLDGRDIREPGLEDLRSQVGVVTQESFLFNGTIMENLRFGKPDATLAEIEAAARAAHAHDFISTWPDLYNTKVGERGVKLSIGEKQRVSIARALLKNPPVLILDEATASVDTATERKIQDALDHLLAGRTSLIIAHRLSTIRNADQIAVIKGGAVIEHGTHDELLAINGLYAKLCRIQQGDVIRDEQLEKVFDER